MDVAQMNWAAVALGTVLAFGLGMLWFSPKMFGKGWVEGSHGITPPDSPPIAAMCFQFVGTLVLAMVVGMTETNEAIMTAIGSILAVALIVAGMDLFSQKSSKATMIDAGYVVVGGALMVASQAVL